MDKTKFLDWLSLNKGLSNRSAHDVISRIKRVLNFLDVKDLDNNSIEKLNKILETSECSVTVKSQLRRSVILYLEFKRSI